MSSHLVWSIIRNNNAFLLKKRNISKPFSTETNNLTNLNSFRYNGLIHKRSIGIIQIPDKKGFTMDIKAPTKKHKPKKYTMKTHFKYGARRALMKVKRVLETNRYRTDLKKAALRRASAVIRSQKPLPARQNPNITKPAKKTE